MQYRSHSEAITVFTTSVDLTVDWMGDMLYWTDQSRHVVETYNIRTDEQGMMLSTMSLPWGVAVDPLSG